MQLNYELNLQSQIFALELFMNTTAGIYIILNVSYFSFSFIQEESEVFWQCVSWVFQEIFLKLNHEKKFVDV